MSLMGDCSNSKKPRQSEYFTSIADRKKPSINWFVLLQQQQKTDSHGGLQQETIRLFIAKRCGNRTHSVGQKKNCIYIYKHSFRGVMVICCFGESIDIWMKPFVRDCRASGEFHSICFTYRFLRCSLQHFMVLRYSHQLRLQQ